MKKNVKFKRILPLVLSLLLIFGSMNVMVFAVGTDPLVTAFGDGIFNKLTPVEGNKFVDLVMLFEGVSDKAGLATAYSNSFAPFTRLKNLGLTQPAINAFATYIDNSSQDFSEAALRFYINNSNRIAGRAAFDTAMADRESAFIAALNVDGITTTQITNGFTDLKDLFSILSKFNTAGLKIYRANADGTLTVDSTVTAIIALANEIITSNPIEDVTSMTTALTNFTTYYNGSGADRTLIYNYLFSNQLVTPYVGGGSTGGGGTTTPPVVVPPVVVPEGPTAQDLVEQASTVQIPATVTQSGNDVTLSSNVTQTTLTSALETAKAAVAKAEPAKTEDKPVKTMVVLEVPKQEGKAATTTQVSLPLSALKEIETAGAQGVTVKSELGQVTFDSAAISTGTQGAGTADTVSLEIKTVKQEDLVGKNVPAGAVVVNFSLKVNDVEVKEFTKPISIKVPYTLKAGENPEQITVYFLNDAGISEPVGGRYNSQTGMIEFETNHFSQYYVSKATRSFDDVTVDFWAKAYIENLGSKGFINGKTITTFAPQDAITRAEFVAIVARMYKLVGNTGTLKFDDIKADDWFAQDVAAAYQAGLIKGRTDTSFDPNAQITRQEMAVVIANTLSYLGYEKAANYSLTDAFVDASQVDSWAKDAVVRTYNKKIINGKPGQLFDPLAKATRAETAKMLYVLYYLP